MENTGLGRAGHTVELILNQLSSLPLIIVVSSAFWRQDVRCVLENPMLIWMDGCQMIDFLGDEMGLRYKTSPYSPVKTC
jgi:hypothetical protein